MKNQLTGKIISRYLLGSVLPYFGLAWLLISVVLFLQQANRYSEIFFDLSVPSDLAWRISLGLIPNVIAFTCPMAILAGTVIGLSKLRGDSELIAIRASGVGNWQIVLPIAILGIILSVFSLIVNWKGVPLAASLVRNAALESTIKKLESPIQPGEFNADIGGYTVFARSADPETGRLTDLFIYSDSVIGGIERAIISRKGRIDTSDERSELVLENASVLSLPAVGSTARDAIETIGEVRIAVKTKRGELLQKLSHRDQTPDELGLDELRTFISTAEGAEKIEAEILWQRRLLLSITPLIFSILGTVMVLRFNRGGRGFGILLVFGALVGYYLTVLASEQLARGGRFPRSVSIILPILASLVAVIWLSYIRPSRTVKRLFDQITTAFTDRKAHASGMSLRSRLVDLTTGIRDLDVVLETAKYFLLGILFLASLFLIFTAFDMWRFAAAMSDGVWLLIKYLTYLLPFIYLQIVSVGILVGVLTAFIIRSRSNELIVWASSGVSMFRVLLPVVMLAILLGFSNFAFQELIGPDANLKQDHLRKVIRSGGKDSGRSIRQWIVDDSGRILTFIPSTPRSGEQNDPALISSNTLDPIENVRVFTYDQNKTALRTVTRADRGEWQNDGLRLSGNLRKWNLELSKITRDIEDREVVDIAPERLLYYNAKPQFMTVGQISESANFSKSTEDHDEIKIAFHKRLTTLFIPLIIVLISASFAIELGRGSKIVGAVYAVGVWLIFIGAASLSEQLGVSGQLSPTFAVWGPVLLFGLLGVFLVSRIRT